MVYTPDLRIIGILLIVMHNKRGGKMPIILGTQGYIGYIICFLTAYNNNSNWKEGRGETSLEEKKRKK